MAILSMAAVTLRRRKLQALSVVSHLLADGALTLQLLAIPFGSMSSLSRESGRLRDFKH